MIIMWNTVYHKEEPHQPYICISRRDRESADLWVQNYYLALMLEKPFEEIDSYAYKAKHSTLDAKVVFDYGGNKTPLLYLNETATMLVMDYCGAPEAAKNAVKKLFKEIAADKNIQCIAAFFDENWNEEEDSPRYFSWWTEKPRTLPTPEDLRDYSSETGYRETTDGFVIKAPAEPLTWDELVEWNALQIDALKKQNGVALDQTITKLCAAHSATDAYCREFHKNNPNPTEQELDELHKKVDTAQKECNKLEVELRVLRTMHTYPACWSKGDRDIFRLGLCLDAALRNNEISDDFFENKEYINAVVEKHYAALSSYGEILTASEKVWTYPIRKEENTAKPEEQPNS